jgi:tRNA(Ile)-lysidine synthase
VAVSGGADSLCLALLTAHWASNRGLPVLALVVDHGLRPASSVEARVTCDRLTAIGIGSQMLVLDGLVAGAGIARRARLARYQALAAACRAAGAVDLLLGHHAGDQAETVLMRQRAGSGRDGLAGMALLSETADLRLLRPLLTVPPERLRATLAASDIGWVEDPSNQDARAERTRVRQELGRTPALAAAMLDQAGRAGQARMTASTVIAGVLASGATVRPEGFALLPPDLLPEPALSALIRAIGGRPYRATPSAVAGLVRRQRPATLAGTRLMPAGRLGPGWLLIRESEAMALPIPATIGACWDDRFVLEGSELLPADLEIAALGSDRPADGVATALPSAVLETLPTLRRGGVLVAVPHFGWAIPGLGCFRFAFRPPAPVSEAMLFTSG